MVLMLTFDSAFLGGTKHSNTDIKEAVNLCCNCGDIGNTSKRDTSAVTDMSELFKDIKDFNQAFISKWNVSNVTNMHSMLNGASAFNQPLGQ